MRLEVLNYDKNKAKFKFALFKFLELFGLFIIIFGFETLGRWSYENLQVYLSIYFVPTTYFGFWLYGLVTFITFLVAVSIITLAIYTVYLIVKEWVKLNWRWAKISSEDDGAKAERLLDQSKLKEIKRIKKLKSDRKKFGYCKGDTAIREKSGDFGWIGDKYEIKKVWSNGNLDLDFKGEHRTLPGKFKFIKNKILKEPKLSKIRAKEVKEKQE